MGQLVPTSDFFAGFGDGLTFGAAKYLRRGMGIDGTTNYCSGSFKAGAITGMFTFAISGNLLLRGAISWLANSWGVRTAAQIGSMIGGAMFGADRMVRIGAIVTGLGLTQRLAAVATNAAVEGLSLRTGGIAPFGGHLVVLSRQPGVAQPVLAVSASGVVTKMAAHIDIVNGQYVIRALSNW